MIYVDQIKPTRRSRAWPFLHSCHLFADSVEELHGFATGTLGMRRDWFQQTAHPHYDLSPLRRKIALANGAVEMTTKEIILKLRANGCQQKAEHD